MLWCLLFFTELVYAQIEATNWYFGRRAGLTFETADPTPLNDGELSTQEGCATISGRDGALQFYTNGETVWNHIHQVMRNGEGLLGSFSATQSALIVPHPGLEGNYYIFTTDNVQAYILGDGNGFNYSEVDMDLDNRRGAVIRKNINLLPQGSEKVSAIGTIDNSEFWVVTHFVDRFYAYRVTEAGLDPIPVESIVGPAIASSENIRGSIKLSPNGRYLAVAHALFDPQLGGQLFLYDFDTDTGVVSNERVLAEDQVFYGVEFSPGSDRLFSSSKVIDEVAQETDNVQILEFDLTAPDIALSRYLVADFSGSSFSDLAGTMQLAINNKIYHSTPGRNLSVIQNPGSYGPDVGFEKFVVDLGQGRSSFGLPPFVQSFLQGQDLVAIEAQGFCFKETTQFSLTNPEVVTSVMWDFDDPSTGNNNTSVSLSPSHVYSRPGDFRVTAIVEIESRFTYLLVYNVTIAPLLEDSDVTTRVDRDDLYVLIDDEETYQYSLDSMEERQYESVFRGLLPGFYKLYVWREECLVYETLVNVNGAPMFFTPNTDGYHDVWKLRGAEKFPGIRLLIFDRYGKLLYEGWDASATWDGTYNGIPMPSSDYWYRLEIDTWGTLSGNFTLKR